MIFFIFAFNQAYNDKPKGFFPIKEYGKWGYINSAGKTIIPCQFDWAGEFSEGLAAFFEDSLYGFVDTTGKIVIQPTFIKVSKFSDGLCQVVIKNDTCNENKFTGLIRASQFSDNSMHGFFGLDNCNQKAFINKDGSIAFYHSYKNIGLFKYGSAFVTINNEICFMDKTGKVIFNTHCPPGYNREFSDGIISLSTQTAVWVKQNDLSEIMVGDTTKYFDTSGKVMLLLMGSKTGRFSEGLLNIKINNKPVYIDVTGKPVITNLNDKYSYRSFSDGLAIVYEIGNYPQKVGFIDKSGKFVIPLKTQEVGNEIHDFKDGLAAIYKQNKWGFIDKKGNIAIKPQFEEIVYDGFKDGLCKVKQNNQWGYINHQGEFVWKEQVGIEYKKLDLSKWKLDTLKIDQPLWGGKYISKDNIPRNKNYKSLSELTLKVDTTDLTVFSDKYLAIKLYLNNSGKDTIYIPRVSTSIPIIQQAKNMKGEWQDIENFYKTSTIKKSHYLVLAPGEFQVFASPVFKGSFKTVLRFKLELFDNKVVYSNQYNGYINPGQFLAPEDKDTLGVFYW